MVREETENMPPKVRSGRLSKAERRAQLLEVACDIIRKEGTDRLTLAYLATCAGVTKPISYEHFGSRTGLLLALYKMLDDIQTEGLRKALVDVQGNMTETINVLARTYIQCEADTSGEWHLVAAALAGSEGVGAAHQELLDNHVQLVTATLAPFCELDEVELKRRCIGLIGAGEALSIQMVKGLCREDEACETFAALIRGGIGAN